MPTKNLSQVEPAILLQLINHYDKYIQNASKNECYRQENWEPLTIEDYFDTEFQLMVKTTEPTASEQQLEQQVATSEEKQNTGWSTFSKNELIKPKQKPWWRKLLPW